MKNIIKSTLLLLCSVCLFTACSDDNGSNPTFTCPSEFVLNTPSYASNTVDLAHSNTIVFTASQPNYGYPTAVTYTMEVASKADMSDAVALSGSSSTPKFELDPAEIAADLTQLYVNQGKTEEDFPMNVKAYFRATAIMNLTTGETIKQSEIKSNVVEFSNVALEFSLPPVELPENVYVVGNFNGWSWENSVSMIPVYGDESLMWRMVYIDGSGIKFNTAKAWDGGEKGYAGITVDASSELGSEIQASSDGNIASSNPGWYLMILKMEVDGRNIKYTATFNKPEVRFIGVMVDGWDEGLGDPFTVPTTADGAFTAKCLKDLPGDDTGCIRMYVKIPGCDWWKSEFVVGLEEGKISYRGAGDDQSRVGCSKDQVISLYFSTDKGTIE